MRLCDRLQLIRGRSEQNVRERALDHCARSNGFGAKLRSDSCQNKDTVRQEAWLLPMQVSGLLYVYNQLDTLKLKLLPQSGKIRTKPTPTGYKEKKRKKKKYFRMPLSGAPVGNKRQKMGRARARLMGEG